MKTKMEGHGSTGDCDSQGTGGWETALVSAERPRTGVKSFLGTPTGKS